MKARTFNSVMVTPNQRWVAQSLGLDINGKGPDMYGKNCIVEVKFSLVDEAGRYPTDWTVLEHQMNYALQHPDKNAYWGLGLYRLDRAVSDIGKGDVPNLENFVKGRELWVVPWEWMNQFPPHSTKGKTKLSTWNNILRYPKKKFIPKAEETYQVNKGWIYLTEGINPEDFPGLSITQMTSPIPPQFHPNLMLERE